MMITKGRSGSGMGPIPKKKGKNIGSDLEECYGGR